MFELKGKGCNEKGMSGAKGVSAWGSTTTPLEASYISISNEARGALEPRGPEPVCSCDMPNSMVAIDRAKQ